MPGIKFVNEADFDAEFVDDTPPATPYKHAAYRPARPTVRPIEWRLPRLRTLILSSVLFVGIVGFFLTGRRRTIFRPKHEPSLRYKKVDWRYYAYSQYATDPASLCSAVMVFEALDRLGSRADRILMYPREWTTMEFEEGDRIKGLLRLATYYKVKPVAVKILGKVIDDTSKWNEGTCSERGQKTSDGQLLDVGITKFLALNQTQYLRIIHFDSDVKVLKHMDELFLLPGTTVATTRVYSETQTLSSRFLLVQPSVYETERVTGIAHGMPREGDEFAGAVVNEAYRDSAMVLPHRLYGLSVSEFHATEHSAFLGNEYEKWDPERAMREASLVHFTDDPVPKPWTYTPEELLTETLPPCDFKNAKPDDIWCRNRKIWLNLYDDFRRRRNDVCKLPPMPAPQWPPKKTKNAR